MKRYFVFLIAVLMLVLAACSSESQDKISRRYEVENVTVVGEIAEIKIDPAYSNSRAATLFRVVDSEGKNYYFALGGIVDQLKVGQKLKVEYRLRHSVQIFANGTERIVSTRGLSKIASTYELNKNMDGSSSFERVDWGKPNKVTILSPIVVPKTITLSN